MRRTRLKAAPCWRRWSGPACGGGRGLRASSSGSISPVRWRRCRLQLDRERCRELLIAAEAAWLGGYWAERSAARNKD